MDNIQVSFLATIDARNLYDFMAKFNAYAANMISKSFSELSNICNIDIEPLSKENKNINLCISFFADVSTNDFIKVSHNFRTFGAIKINQYFPELHNITSLYIDQPWFTFAQAC